MIITDAFQVTDISVHILKRICFNTKMSILCLDFSTLKLGTLIVCDNNVDISVYILFITNRKGVC